MTQTTSEPAPCHWHAVCGRPATQIVSTAMFGRVSACDACAQFAHRVAPR